MSKRPKYLSRAQMTNVAAFSDIRDDIYLVEASEKRGLEEYLVECLSRESEKLERAENEDAVAGIRQKIADLELLASADDEYLRSHFELVQERLTDSLQRLMTHEGARKKIDLNEFEQKNLERMGKMTREARFKLRLFVEAWLREVIGS